MASSQFLPFYERLSFRFFGNTFSRILISGLLGLAFLVIHYASIGNQILHDWSWFLGVLISTMMLALYIATHTLHALLSRMEIYSSHANQTFDIGLKRSLSNRNFVLVGAFFGILNCVFGYSFGLPYPNEPAVTSILVGYFLAGFIGGMAVLGIYGVFVAIRVFSREIKFSLDFTSPDNCGGTLFIGEALVVFSSVTMIVGVMISIYIFGTHWAENHTWVIALKYFWVVFPYVMSLIILITPAIPLHIELRRYKREHEALLTNRLGTIRRSLEDNQPDGTSRRELREDQVFLQNARKELHGMRLWPYGIDASSRYVIILIANLIATLNNFSGWAKPLKIITGW